MMEDEVTVHTTGVHDYGADFSVFMGVGVAAVVYLVLGWRSVRGEADAQDRMLATTGTR